MIAETTTQDIVIIIGAITTATVTVIGSVFAGLAAFRVTRLGMGVDRKVDVITTQIEQVHGEVKTLNAKTIGTLAGEQETRRIVGKAPEDRTFSDQQHLHDVPPEPVVVHERPAFDVSSPLGEVTGVIRDA